MILLRISNPSIFQELEKEGKPKIMKIKEYFDLLQKEDSSLKMHINMPTGYNNRGGYTKKIEKVMKSNGWTREQAVDWLYR